MEMSMLIGAMSGALAALIAGIVSSKAKRMKALVFAVIFIPLFAGLKNIPYAEYFPELYEASRVHEIESEIKDIPIYQTIKQYDPKAYEEIQVAYKKLVNEGRSDNEMIPIVQMLMKKVLNKHMMTASDKAVNAFASTALAGLKELQPKGNGMCYDYLYPDARPIPINWNKHLSKQYLDTEQEVMIDVIKSSAENPQALPSMEEVDALLINNVFAGLIKEHGDDISLLENVLAPGIDKDKVCAVTISMFTSILELSPIDSSKVMRVMSQP